MQISESDYTALFDELVKFIVKKVRDKSTAEDIVQEVFIKIHENLHQLQDPGKRDSWIYQIARNTLHDYFRKNSTTINPVDVDWETSRQELNDCAAYCLTVIMSSLPEKYRVALELTEMGDLSQAELAHVLNISHAGARSRVQRARQMLRRKMDELFIIKTDCYGNVIFCKDRNPCCCGS
jgi:RNA polymerase sigma-70 factor, ECF subfamily